MTIDKESIENFENQIRVLESLKESVEGAIKRANERLKKPPTKNWRSHGRPSPLSMRNEQSTPEQPSAHL